MKFKSISLEYELTGKGPLPLARGRGYRLLAYKRPDLQINCIQTSSAGYGAGAHPNYFGKN